MFEGAGALRNYWYVVAFGDDLGRKPKRAELWGTPIALWRDAAGKPVAMLDRCPHRDVPLSKGTVADGCITCPYHGWTFDGAGTVVRVPSMGPDKESPKSRRVRTFPVIERDGMLWLWPGETPPPAGSAPPTLGEDPAESLAGMRFYRRSRIFDADALDLVENFMDSPHTAVVHRGIIRGHRTPARAVLDVNADTEGVLVSHAGGDGDVALGRGFAKKGRSPADYRHSDHFLLPSAVRVDYRLGSAERRFLAFIFCTPVGEGKTLAHITLGLQLGWMTPLARLALPLLTSIVLKQDARVMRWQRDNRRTFAAAGSGFLDSDIMHVMVRELWQWARDRQKPFAALHRRVEVHL